MIDRLDVHTHTIMSGHAYNTMSEMIKAAADKGLELFGITEHAPKMPGSCKSLYFGNFGAIPRKQQGMTLLMGVELNIMNETGRVDLNASLLKTLDICIASIHLPCYGESRGKALDTQALVKAMENPLVDVIGHPDDGRYPLDYEAVIKAAKEHNVLLEVNSSSLSERSFREGARENYEIMLSYCEKYEVPVVINSDAHVISEVGQHERAIALMESLHFPEELVMNASADKLLDFLKARRSNVK